VNCNPKPRTSERMLPGAFEADVWRVWMHCAYLILPDATVFAWLVSLAVFLSVPLQASDDVPWKEIKREAEAFVRGESPAVVWPFERPGSRALSDRGPRVFANYFTPFPLSIDHREVSRDYYETQYLSPGGEGGKFLRKGGYLRQRPLTPDPWKSKYWRQTNYAIEILRAREIGLDGFICDLLTIDSGMLWDHTRMLLDTAEAVAPGFGIVLMPDMSSLQVSKGRLVGALERLSRRPAAYRLPNGRLLLIPYNAQLKPVAWWRSVLKSLENRGVRVAFLPVFQGWNTYARQFEPLCYGMSDWGLRDVDAIQANRAVMEQVSDYTPRWMMPVAPQDVRPKDAIYWESGNTRAFRALWSTAIEQKFPYVHLIMWNDYSEHTEISPSTGTQFLFYDLSAYYTSWLKTGRAPRIRSDAIYYCHRTQMTPLESPATRQDTPFKLLGATPPINEIEMVALLTAPATLEIQIGGKTYQQVAAAGLAVFAAPAGYGWPVFRIVRDGKPVVETTSHWEIVKNVGIQNPVYFGGSSTRDFHALPTR